MLKILVVFFHSGPAVSCNPLAVHSEKDSQKPFFFHGFLTINGMTQYRYKNPDLEHLLFAYKKVKHKAMC